MPVSGASERGLPSGRGRFNALRSADLVAGGAADDIFDDADDMNIEVEHVEDWAHSWKGDAACDIEPDLGQARLTGFNRAQVVASRAHPTDGVDCSRALTAGRDKSFASASAALL